MKIRKFVGTLLLLNMCFVPVASVYGQDLTTTSSVQAVQEQLMTKEILLASMEGNPLYKHFETLIKNDGTSEQVTWQLAGRIVCDYLGLSPLLLPPKEACSDGYLGRLKVEGILDAQVSRPTEILTRNEWNGLIDTANSYLLGATKETSYQEKLAKSNIGFDEVVIGKLVKGKSILSYGGFEYPLYEVANTSYVRLNDLKQIGLVPDVNSVSGSLIFPTDAESKPTDGKVLEGVAKSYKAYSAIGGLKTYSLTCGDEILVPVRALGSLFSLDITEQKITLVPSDENMGAHVLMDDSTITNTSDRPIDLRFTSLYWDGKAVQKVTQEIYQLPQDVPINLPTKYFSLINDQTKYITTLVDEVSYVDDLGATIHHNYERYDSYGQSNVSYFEAYEKGKQPVPQVPPVQHDAKLFPDTIITGTMKYSTGSLKKGQKVEVWAAEKGSDYTVIANGKKVRVPWDSVSIPSNPPVQKEPATKAQLESHINSKGFTSKTNYLVWTDLYRQRTYVFKNQGGQWVLHKQMLCSTGNNKTPTPRGEYTLTSYVPAFGMNKGYMCKNAVGIFGDYLYHSVMFDKTGSYELSGVGKLGHQASSGCIRLSYEDSVWFYKNMPLGTKVWIN